MSQRSESDALEPRHSRNDALHEYFLGGQGPNGRRRGPLPAGHIKNISKGIKKFNEKRGQQQKQGN